MARATGWKKKTLRELASDLRARDRQKLRDLRHRIQSLKLKKRAALASIRSECKAERARVAAAIRSLRSETLAALRVRAQDMRTAARGTCSVAKNDARSKLAHELDRAAQELREERVTQHIVRTSDKRHQVPGRSRIASKERLGESDDEVIRNLSPDMAAVFQHVRRSIKGSPRRTRTEAFLEWAHDNPDEVWTIRQADAEADLQKLIAEEEEHYRSMQSSKRYRDPEAMAIALANVPF